MFAFVVWIKLIRDGEDDILEDLNLDGAMNVSRLRRFLKEQWPNILGKFDPPQLKVYPVGTPTDNLSMATPLEVGAAVPMTTTLENPLIVSCPQGLLLPSYLLRDSLLA